MQFDIICNIFNVTLLYHIIFEHTSPILLNPNCTYVTNVKYYGVKIHNANFMPLADSI